MYVFSRARNAHPAHVSEAVGFAVEISTMASAITATPVRCWMSVMSPNAGELLWAASFDSLADWEVAVDKLAADSAYLGTIRDNDHLFTGATVDGMVEMVTPTAAVDQTSTYVAIVRAAAAGGHLADAVGHGIAIAEGASRASGLTTQFGVSVTGLYGGVGWLTGAPDIATLQAARTALNSDSALVALIDRGGNYYQAGSAHQAVYRRVV